MNTVETTAPARPFRRGDFVRVGDSPDVATVESVAPATVGGEPYAVLYWPKANTRTTWAVSRLVLHDSSYSDAIREAARAELAHGEAADTFAAATRRSRDDRIPWDDRYAAVCAARDAERASYRVWLAADRQARELGRKAWGR